MRDAMNKVNFASFSWRGSRDRAARYLGGFLFLTKFLDALK